MPDKDQFMTHQEIIMKNNLNEVINDRLKNRIEWRNYLAWLLTHKELQMQAKKEFYKDKLILNLIMKFYFSKDEVLRRHEDRLCRINEIPFQIYC